MTTPELLPLTTISHRIYTLILRILHNRLVVAAELHPRKLLLECFHPSAKLTEEPYFCSYRGTDGLTLYHEDANDIGRLGDMYNMYSSFRPHRRDLEAEGRKVRPRPGDVPGSRTYPDTVQDRSEGEAVKQTLNLESHELFTQLVAQAHLATTDQRGRPMNFVEIEDGVIRVWRDWLKEMAARGSTVHTEVPKEVVEAVGKDKEVVKEVPEQQMDLEDSRILWASPRKNSGIRFNVRERKLHRDVPILIRTDEEDMPVSYKIEYDGESNQVFAVSCHVSVVANDAAEFFVRTSHLLLMLEQSMVQEDNSGKAVVFGSFG
jgi:hypothetical protein